MKLSFARKEDEALLFTASSSSSSFPDGGGNVLAIGLCDVAGAGVRALKSLTTSRESGGKQLKRRDFELKFTDENGGDLVGKMIGNNGEKEADEEEEEEEEDDISALERAIFVKTSDDGEALDLIEDTALNGDFSEMLDIRERLARLAEREARLKQRIQQRMGDAARAYFMDGQVSWKRSKDSTVLDTDALLKTQPTLLQQFPKHRAGSRRFLVKPNA